MKLLIIIFLQGRSLRFSGYQIAYVFTGKVYLVFNESLSIHKILSAGVFLDFLYLFSATGNNKLDFRQELFLYPHRVSVSSFQ